MPPNETPAYHLVGPSRPVFFTLHPQLPYSSTSKSRPWPAQFASNLGAGRTRRGATRVEISGKSRISNVHQRKKFSWGGIPVPNTLEHTGALKTNTAFSIWSRATHPSWTQPPQRWCCEFLRFALAPNGSSHDHKLVTRILDARVWVPSRMGVPHADVAICSHNLL